MGDLSTCRKFSLTKPTLIHDKNSQHRKNRRSYCSLIKTRVMIIFIGRIPNAIPLRIATRQITCSSLIQHFSGAEHIFRAGKQEKEIKSI